MKKMIFSLFALASLVGVGNSARAQFAVVDATVDADITQMQMDTLVPMLNEERATAATTADQLKMLSTPYVVTGKFTTFDGSAVVDSTTQSTELLPALGGTSHTSTSSTAIGVQDDADLTTDETTGTLKGNSYQAQLTRRKTQTDNLLGMGVDDFKANTVRLDKAETLNAEVEASLNIMQATVMGDALQVENLKQQVLNGKTIAALEVTENARDARLNARDQRHIDDHTATAKLLGAP